MKLGLIAFSVSAALFAQMGYAAEAAQQRDEFFWLGEINKASLVINAEQGLLPKDVSRKIAGGLERVLDNGNKKGGPRPNRVIKFEPYLIKEAGMDATMLHVGRSSQDMHATYYSAIMRDNVLRLSGKLADTMAVINELAKSNVGTIVPNYTNGVAAQPNSYAHYLQGFQSGFARDAERLRQFYARLNLCPMGTTVLNGTGWPLNRERMSNYLGFSAPVPNAYDAAQIKPVELGSILVSIALHVGSFIQDVSVQYAQPRPWILLQEGGDNTYVSSAMPQKRNPGLMINVRESASNVISEGLSPVILAHNIVPGMIDPKRVAPNSRMVNDTIKMLDQYMRVLKALRIDPQRSLEELNSDWTASQEIADELMRNYKLPFRVGHHVASKMVSYAKAHNIKPTEFPYARMQQIYAEVIDKEYPAASRECPMSEADLRKALDPAAIIANRKTAGGPQKAELQKALARTDGVIEQNRKWTKSETAKINESLARLDKDFKAYLD
ncbi:lyase family protein [Mesosutterella sp. AGMB02718]|uniref:Lyase family protein n=1 Tax=Mesosutterella faecium TaxID=2925194 RepID=A0ABT7INQ8_9BURK|nr:lyase family protein [Mesosutterella sp. AGMB02718]MDL2060009.1 lyase family protein [Mesosutterella sp. AGMB02718]